MEIRIRMSGGLASATASLDAHSMLTGPCPAAVLDGQAARLASFTLR